MKVIRGKSALVTGAASGIGRAIALELAREGARIYLLDINDAGLAKVANEVRALGVEAVTYRCDVSVPLQITSAVRYILARWGAIDILVNNAGLTYYGRTINMSGANWDRLLAVNLSAPIHFTRALMPTMVHLGESHILNVASILGLVGLARVAAYSTTKFGLVGFSESLRHECGRMGVGVTALCPGFVDTKLFTSAPRGKDLKQSKVPPSWTLITPEKVAKRAIRAIYRNQPVVVMQPTSWFVWLTKRYAPWLLDLAHHLRMRKQKPEKNRPAIVAPKQAEPAKKRAA